MTAQRTPLTPGEKKVFEFIKSFFHAHDYAPSYKEIQKHFQWSSIFAVQRYIKQLQKKEYLSVPKSNEKRAIQIIEELASPQEEVPLLGAVSAGQPIEFFNYDEFLPVPMGFLKSLKNIFALTVKGDSMIDEGICDGDQVLIKKQETAKNGDIVVATVEEEATLKRFYLKGSQVELRPSNSQMESFFFPADKVKIKGLLQGLLRKY